MARTSPVNTGYTIINGTTSGSNGTKVDTWIEYKVTGQSVANNTSTIRVILYSAATKSSSTSWESAENFGYVGYDNGNKQYLKTTYDFSNYQVNKFGDHTYTIAHNSDGTKTITLQGSWSTSHSSYISGGVVPASGVSSSVTLPQIARASSVSNFTGTLGAAGTITITRASSSFTHTLQYSFDNSNWTDIATGVGTSYSWTPNVSLISNFSNQKTKTGYIRCITYSGGTNVGSKTSTMTLSVPSTTLGSVSATIGKSVTLTATNPCASGLTYQFAYSNGSTWTNIGSAQTGKTISWSIPTSLIGNISNAKSKGFSIRVITKIGSVEVNTATATATLTIPANTSQNITGTIGSAVSIPITKAHSNLTSTIAYSFGSSGTTTIVTTTTSTSYSWTPPTSLLTQIPNSISGTGSITITTYNGSASCGSNTYTLTLSAASSVVPTSSLSLTMINNNAVVNGWGIYLQGYSQVRATLTGNGVSGSTVKNMSVTGSGLSASSTPSTSSATLTQTSSVLQTSGTLTYKGNVSDSRNRNATEKSQSISVVPYTPPNVTGISLARSNAQGNIDSTGTYLKVAFTLTYSTAGNHNTASVSLRYKATSDTSWTDYGVVANGDNLNLDLDVAENFEAQLIVSDSLNTNESAIINIPSAERVLNVNMSGSGLAIGGFSEDPGKLEVYYPTDFKGNTLPTINGEMFIKEAGGYNLYGATRLPSTCDLNDITTAGIYYTNTGDGFTIANLPTLGRNLGAFNLKVERWMNVATPSIENNWQGVMQTFYHYDGSIFYRVFYRSDSASNWQYVRWMHLNEGVGGYNDSSAKITDANNMTISGSYWVGSAYVSNLPVASGWFGTLTTENPVTNLYKQTFTAYNNGRTWTRTYANSRWYEWFEITHGDSFASLCTWGNYYTVGTKVTLNNPFTNYGSLIFRLGNNEAVGGMLYQQVDTYLLNAVTVASSSVGYVGYNWYDGSTPTWVTFKFNSTTEVEITGHGGANFGLRQIYGIN